jgi:hypothetical protein
MKRNFVFSGLIISFIQRLIFLLLLPQRVIWSLNYKKGSGQLRKTSGFDIHCAGGIIMLSAAVIQKSENRIIQYLNYLTLLLKYH